MDKEGTTQEGQVTYLTRVRRPGYLPALAPKALCVFIFAAAAAALLLYIGCRWLKTVFMNIHTNRLAVFIVCHGEKTPAVAHVEAVVFGDEIQRVDAVGVEIGAGVGEQCTGNAAGAIRWFDVKRNEVGHEIGTIMERRSRR